MPAHKRKRSRKSAGPTRATAQWTLLVFMAGDNDLSGAGRADIAEMKKVGSSAAVNVVVQYDRGGAKRGTKRYYVRKGTTIASDQVADLGETNTGDPEVLRAFLEWGVKSYPAQHYVAIVWNHGAGWDDSNLYKGDYFSGATPPVVHKGIRLRESRGRAKPLPKAVPLAQARSALNRARRAVFARTAAKMMTTRAIAFDDQARDFLDNIELRKVLADIARRLRRPIDIVGFDACLMSMLEVDYQIARTARYVVSSQEEEPGDGWPYDRLLRTLTRDPAMTPAQLCQVIIDAYAASYRPSDGVTLSATELAKAKDVATAVDALAKALIAAIDDHGSLAKLAAVRARVQSYTPPYNEYIDLVDLCDGLQHLLPDHRITAAGDAVKSAVRTMIIDSKTKGSGVARSRGVSIYFPSKRVSRLYPTLDFAKRNAWRRFIDAYTAKVAHGGWP